MERIPKFDLRANSGCFTRYELFGMVAEHVGLKFSQNSTIPWSIPFRYYRLSPKWLAKLESTGIKRQEQSDGIITLIDEIAPSQGEINCNYWNFWEAKPRVGLTVNFILSENEGGFELLPVATSTKNHGINRLPHFRMFKVFTETDQEAPEIAKRIVADNGKVLVPFEEMGLEGLCSLEGLFQRFCEGSQAIINLGKEGGIFDPAPLHRYRTHENDYFISVSAQVTILSDWEEQLLKFKDSLVRPSELLAANFATNMQAAMQPARIGG